jgi:hypothetical protein
MQTVVLKNKKIMHWLIILIARILRGERFENDEKQQKYFAGLFVLVPLYLVGVPLLVSTFSKNIFALWVFATISLTILFLLTKVWQNLVPLKVSYVIGGILWVILFWVALHIDLS